MDKEILDNRERYMKRCALYKIFGYDVEKEREFILKVSEPFFGKILEVGTGKGYFSCSLAVKGYKFISVDISDEEQKIARLNFRYFNVEDSVDLRVENAEKMNFADKFFDTIFSVNLLHHLLDASKVMEEFKRVLKQKGKIIISDFTEYGFEVIEKIHNLENKTHERNLFTIKDFVCFFEKEKFSIKNIKSKFQDVVIAERFES